MRMSPSLSVCWSSPWGRWRVAAPPRPSRRARRPAAPPDRSRRMTVPGEGRGTAASPVARRSVAPGTTAATRGAASARRSGAPAWPGARAPSTGVRIVTPIDGGPVSDGGSVCDDLRAEYNAALPGAGDCTPGAPDQCSQMVRTVVGVPPACDPNCMQMYVNDATALTALATAYEQSCPSAATCLLIACEPPRRRPVSRRAMAAAGTARFRPSDRARATGRTGRPADGLAIVRGNFSRAPS